MTYTARFEDRGRVRVVTLTGQLDLAVAKSLESFLTLALAGEVPIVVDFTDAEYVDSTVLTVIARQKRIAGARLMTCLPRTGKLRRIFEIAALDTRLGIAESVDEAMAQLAANPGFREA